MDELRKLNLEMAREETDGNKAFFEDVLAAKVAFRRAGGDFHDRESFLASLKPGSAQRECDPGSIGITLVGEKRAFVTCIVRMKVDDQWKEFHNARLFVLAPEGWRLLAWANEPVTQ